MAFAGVEPVRAKIIVDGKMNKLALLNLGCEISYRNNRDVEEKLTRFHLFCSSIWHTLGKRVHKEMLFKLCKVMVVTSLLYGCKTWTLRAKNIRRVEAAEIRILRWFAGYTILDRRRSEEIKENSNCPQFQSTDSVQICNFLLQLNKCLPHRKPSKSVHRFTS